MITALGDCIILIIYSQLALKAGKCAINMLSAEVSFNLRIKDIEIPMVANAVSPKFSMVSHGIKKGGFKLWKT